MKKTTSSGFSRERVVRWLAPSLVIAGVGILVWSLLAIYPPAAGIALGACLIYAGAELV